MLFQPVFRFLVFLLGDLLQSSPEPSNQVVNSIRDLVAHEKQCYRFLMFFLTGRNYQDTPVEMLIGIQVLDLDSGSERDFDSAAVFFFFFCSLPAQADNPVHSSPEKTEWEAHHKIFPPLWLYATPAIQKPKT